MPREALKKDSNRIISIIASLSSPREFSSPLIEDADALEIRLDLITEPIEEKLSNLRRSYKGPIILTLRSSEEGGAYAGQGESFWERVSPFLNEVDMIDLEIRFREFADRAKALGKTVIASSHQNNMPSKAELYALLDDLRKYGDIPKVALQPKTKMDLVTLVTVCSECNYPVIMSVTGTLFRYARPVLCLFGSIYTYCYIESATSPGQYSLKEMQLLAHLLSPGFVDTWFEGRPVRSGNLYGFL